MDGWMERKGKQDEATIPTLLISLGADAVDIFCWREAEGKTASDGALYIVICVQRLGWLYPFPHWSLHVAMKVSASLLS
jgi:hypothetical protein